MFNKNKVPKPKSHSFPDTLVVITSAKHGELQAYMFLDNGVLESTIHGWLRDEEKLHAFVDRVDSTDWVKRKKARTVPSLQFSHGL